MIFYFYLLLLYFILAGACEAFINGVTLNIVLIAYVTLLTFVVIKRESFDLLKLKKFKFKPQYLTILLIPLANMICLLITNVHFNTEDIIPLLIASIIEELLFRVIVFELIDKTLINKIILTNTLFSIVHIFNVFEYSSIEHVLIQIIFSFSVGMIFTIICIDSQSVVPSAACHALINITSSGVYNITRKVFIIYLFISVICCMISIYYIKKLKRKEE